MGEVEYGGPFARLLDGLVRHEREITVTVASGFSWNGRVQPAEATRVLVLRSGNLTNYVHLDQVVAITRRDGS